MNKFWEHRHFLKLFSIILSFFIWLYVVGSTKIEREKIFPVKILLPQGYSLESVNSLEVKFRLSGPRFLLENYIKKEKTIIINAQKIFKKGQKEYHHLTDRYESNVPLGIEVLDKNVRDIIYSIDKSRVRTLPIKLNFEETFLNEFEIVGKEILPKNVEVVGTRKQIRGLKEVLSERINIKRISKDGFFEVALIKPNDLLVFNTEVAKVKIDIKEKRMDKSFLVKRKRESGASVTLDIKVEGSKLDLDRLATTDLKVTEVEGEWVVTLPVGFKLLKVIELSARE